MILNVIMPSAPADAKVKNNESVLCCNNCIRVYRLRGFEEKRIPYKRAYLVCPLQPRRKTGTGNLNMSKYIILIIITLTSIPILLVGSQADNIMNKTIDDTPIYFINIHDQIFTGVILVSSSNTGMIIGHSSNLNITGNILISINDGKGKLYHTTEYNIPFLSCWYQFIPCELVSDYSTPTYDDLISQFGNRIREV